MNWNLHKNTLFSWVVFVLMSGCETTPTTTVSRGKYRIRVPRSVVENAKTVLAGEPIEWEGNILPDGCFGDRDIIRISDISGKTVVFWKNRSNYKRVNDGHSLKEISTIMQFYCINSRSNTRRRLENYCTHVMDLHSGIEQLSLFPTTIDQDSLLAYSKGDPKLAMKLSRLATQSSIKLEKSRFSASFHALQKNGAVDRWVISGSLKKNVIWLKSIAITQIAPPGTFFFAVIGKR